jgi:hypothetical protein
VLSRAISQFPDALVSLSGSSAAQVMRATFSEIAPAAGSTSADRLDQQVLRQALPVVRSEQLKQLTCLPSKPPVDGLGVPEYLE